MNMVNASTGYTAFQLHLGHSPKIIPPIIPLTLPHIDIDTTTKASQIITQIQNDVADM